MFHFCKNNSLTLLLKVAALLAASSIVYADNKTGDQITEVLSNIPSNNARDNNSSQNVLSTPNSSVILDFSVATGESWDSRDDSNNVVANCISGSAITGIEYSNVSIQTFGTSFFSEAIIYFSDSQRNSDGLRLATGAGNEASGTSSFSSDGILDLTDSGLDDVVSLEDGIFITQLYEFIDDNDNAIDAMFTGGTVTVHGVDLVSTNTCPFVTAGVDTPISDLSVTYSTQTDQDSNPKLNETLNFTISVSNVGDGGASNVKLSNTISNKLTFNQMTCDDGSSTSNAEELISFNAQDIPSNSSLICNVEATVINYGSIENSVAVSANNDNNSANNTASVMLRGAFRVVPVNNYFSLFLLAICFIYFTRKRIL